MLERNQLTLVRASGLSEALELASFLKWCRGRARARGAEMAASRRSIWAIWQAVGFAGRAQRGATVVLLKRTKNTMPH